MLEVCDVTKRYGALTAVSHVSFTVKPGEVLGYLGPNGSGKSTTVKMLTGLMPPTAGRILFDGADIQEDLVAHKARVGYVPRKPMCTPISPVPSICACADGCAASRRRLGGEDRSLPPSVRPRRRLSRDAVVLLQRDAAEDPALGGTYPQSRALIILDEPVSGLDVGTALVLRAVVRALAADGRIIFYSSHELETVEKLSTRVIILRAGRIVADDSASRLRELMAPPRSRMCSRSWRCMRMSKAWPRPDRRG